ncbi:MAG: globin domain-containing protein [Acinetobacter populi]|jgi:nitric oxide dioxygenase|uniref:globin domain-containing protein n=1 Tax=Acinetobacter populi TaxID=1582270 RepID=UPI002356AC74|nr:globin domain-containing protein [Acinetobacter populi]MCH4246617.1 globin domain-containing protein [Acinetobacter populi]
MNEQAIATVKATVPVLRENGVALTSYFYKRMLGNHPELKNVFNLSHQATGRQPRALAAAVLAYAENIEDPSKLLKAVDRIAIKHVSLDIHPDQYAIVGTNLLHSISEVLELPMDHDVIIAWEQAYGQLADILINREKELYHEVATKEGGWSGWRAFKVSAKQQDGEHTTFTLIPTDGLAITPAQTGAFISVKVAIADQGIEQPQQFSFEQAQDNAEYNIQVKRELVDADVPSVSNALLDHVQVGDTVQVTAPLSYH